jgi:2-succinyl-5-enolpyruvyl-6-hydroxy-3-cyclohexene-1-carboxylate synthase
VRLQPIYDIAEICSQHGIVNAVVCPGSRCAPLTISFSRHPSIKVRTFSDERSAAFIALGIAQQTNRPVVLICTSGSAAYNFAPAIAEAFYSHVPLLILTADRPTEWIGQHDGQTIQQKEIYGRHVKKYFELPADYEHADAKWFINRTINQAINFCKQDQAGPVHVNIPLREPLYPLGNETIELNKEVKIIREQNGSQHLNETEVESIQREWKKYTKVLLVGGQSESNTDLLKSVDTFTSKNSVVLCGDVISNLHALPQTIRYSDSFLAHCTDEIKESLKPELLITFGRSVISKNLKLFLRKYKPTQHWHLQPGGEVADTFQSLTRIYRCNPEFFFNQLSDLPIDTDFEEQKRKNFKKLWEVEENRIQRGIGNFFDQPAHSEFHLVRQLMSSLPVSTNLHLANSMTVRYANFIGLNQNQSGAYVFSNRGTSGIDGCTSTSVGHSLSSDRLNILITGDLAFFYDRNAFWHNYNLPSLRIVVLNNHGGVIFGMIDGPGELPEAEELFITKQKLSAKNLCQEFNIEYNSIENAKQMKNLLKDFFEPSQHAKVIEIETDSKTSKQVFEQFKQLIKKSYES